MSIVFYAEDAASWRYFEPVVCHLTEKMGRRVTYLTSAPDDPMLKSRNPNITALGIGAGAARTFLFMGLTADVMVMTMPDLETFHIKRSKFHPAHYAYIFHSMASTHMVYQRGAYDHFDTILCVGPHQKEEIRRREKMCGLPEKRLAEHGYAVLDRMMAESAERVHSKNAKTEVLVAPSWDSRGLLNSCGPALVSVLLDASLNVTLRPHPISLRKSPQVIAVIEKRFGGRNGFRLETTVESEDSLYSSDVMITDWSGAGLEFAFALERPLVFVDVPRKVNNPNYEELGIEPLEAKIRAEVGSVVSPDELHRVPGEISRLIQSPESFRRKIAELRAKYVYNVGRSGEAGAAILARLADEAGAIHASK